jgi:hypothetical protein
MGKDDERRRGFRVRRVIDFNGDEATPFGVGPFEKTGFDPEWATSGFIGFDVGTVPRREEIGMAA